MKGAGYPPNCMGRKLKTPLTNAKKCVIIGVENNLITQKIAATFFERGQKSDLKQRFLNV